MANLIFGISGMAVGIIGAVVALVTLARTKTSADKTEAKEDGIVLTEIGYIKAGVDDLKRDNRDTRAEMQLMHDKLARTDESCKQAHKRIDNLEKFHLPN